MRINYPKHKQLNEPVIDCGISLKIKVGTGVLVFINPYDAKR